MPLAFQPADDRKPAMRASEWANEFCRRMTETTPGCKLCLEAQEQLCHDDGHTHTVACRAGLTDSAVPVRVGDKLLGYLQTGQVALKKPTKAAFHKLVQWLGRSDTSTDWHALEKAYLDSPVLGRAQYDAMVRLLEVFAQHLALAAEQIATQQDHSEPPLVTKAREFIEQHQGEEIALADVARAVHASTFHFCKTFKKATGFTFTQYVSLVRVAKAKHELANPQKRISEIAYEVGFQSLTHFNRIFRKITGQNPSEYREQVLKA